MVIKVNGMMCSHCQARVEKAIQKLDGVKSVTVDLTSKMVSIEGDISLEKVKAAVENAGYSVEDV